MAPSSDANGPLYGRAALVTGGGTGIGRACAARLAADGAVVTICGRRRDVLEAACAQIGHGARHVVCDVTDEDQVRAAVAAAAEPLERLDVAVANAGGGASAPLVATTLESWNSVLSKNLTGTFLTIKHAAQAMIPSAGGSIVAISSIAGALTHRLMAAYCVSKAGLEMLVRNAADELGEHTIRVNAIRPGLVPTDASAILVQTPAIAADYVEQTPLGRLGTLDDVASAVSFLAGDEASWITGQIFAVDGGHTLRRGPDLAGAMRRATT